MGGFHIDCEVVNVRRPAKSVRAPKLLVDTGSEFSWIPEPILRAAGIRAAKKDLQFVMVDGPTVTRSTGYAILRAAGFETVDEVVFGQPGDLSLLGSRTLDGFGASVDARKRRLVAAGPHPAAASLPQALELLHGGPQLVEDLVEERRPDLSPAVQRDGHCTPIGMVPPLVTSRLSLL
jgi:predicted aspartyl protease